MVTSWEEPAVRRVLTMPNVRVTRADACQYGMAGQFHGDELPVKKPTKWMSNMKRGDRDSPQDVQRPRRELLRRTKACIMHRQKGGAGGNLSEEAVQSHLAGHSVPP